MGYADLKKGYRCYDPYTKKMHVTRDVTFHENTPFLKNHDCSLQGENKFNRGNEESIHNDDMFSSLSCNDPYMLVDVHEKSKEVGPEPISGASEHEEVSKCEPQDPTCDEGCENHDSTTSQSSPIVIESSSLSPQVSILPSPPHNSET